MKGGNEISTKKMNANAEAWIIKTHQMMTLKDYGKGSIMCYVNELVLLFKYYNHKNVVQITQQDIEAYLLFIKQAHQVGRAKCRSVAQACSYFFKKVLPTDYIVPSNLYPKKQFILLEIMTEDEVDVLIHCPYLTLKEQCVVELLYGSGVRISELCNLGVKDIETSQKRIKVNQGKGSKDRYTLLPDTIIDRLRLFYIEEGISLSAAKAASFHA
jgi:site-specific recombinase XerD